VNSAANRYNYCMLTNIPSDICPKLVQQDHIVVLFLVFLFRTLIAHEIRAIDKWDCIKLKIFSTSKETIIRVETAYTIGQNLCHLTREYRESSKN
jgi:hypothetical protein